MMTEAITVLAILRKKNPKRTETIFIETKFLPYLFLHIINHNFHRHLLSIRMSIKIR